MKKPHPILIMPSQTGRNKSSTTFNQIRDKVRKVLSGWKEKMFSLGRKEVLIKAIVQVISVYTMNCFRIHNGICKEIDRICTNFWWGTMGEKNKNHWMAWRKMCLSKEVEGMGFREISVFNRTMLAKQSWRLIRNPYSLLFKVLRGNTLGMKISSRLL